MRLDQFSWSNHDVGSSAMMATLCIHKRNSKKTITKIVLNLKCFEIHLQCNKLRHFPPVATKKNSTLEVQIKIEFERPGPIGQGSWSPN